MTTATKARTRPTYTSQMVGPGGDGVGMLTTLPSVGRRAHDDSAFACALTRARHSPNGSPRRPEAEGVRPVPSRPPGQERPRRRVTPDG